MLPDSNTSKDWSTNVGTVYFYLNVIDYLSVLITSDGEIVV